MKSCVSRVIYASRRIISAFFEWSLQEICQFGWLISEYLARSAYSDFEGNVMTEYEEKFSAEGYRIYRLEARRRLPEFLKKVNEEEGFYLLFCFFKVPVISIVC